MPKSIATFWKGNYNTTKYSCFKNTYSIRNKKGDYQVLSTYNAEQYNVALPIDMLIFYDYFLLGTL